MPQFLHLYIGITKNGAHLRACSEDWDDARSIECSGIAITEQVLAFIFIGFSWQKRRGGAAGRKDIPEAETASAVWAGLRASSRAGSRVESSRSGEAEGRQWLWGRLGCGSASWLLTSHPASLDLSKHLCKNRGLISRFWFQTSEVSPPGHP